MGWGCSFRGKGSLHDPPLCPWHPQKYDQELYRIAMPCLCAIAGALPPDYVDASYSSKTEKKATVDAEGNFDPRPVETLR